MDEEERALQACERAVIICTSADKLGDVATGAWYGPRPPPSPPPPRPRRPALPRGWLAAAAPAAAHVRARADGGDPTGRFEEIAAPYWVLSHKTDVDIASVAGGKVPLDPGSMQGDFYTESCKAFEGRPDAMHKLENSLKVEDLDPEKYGIVFLAGGHGTCVDFVDNEELGKFLKAVRVKKWNVVSAVCHGVIGLFNMGTDW